MFHCTIVLLTPVFSSKILIPPKETVKKIFCLCSPFERAAATIPYRNKEQVGWFHYSPRFVFREVPTPKHKDLLVGDSSPLGEYLRAFQEQYPACFCLPPFFFFKVAHPFYATHRPLQMCSHFQSLY